METVLDSSGTAEGLEKAIREVQEKGAKGVMVLTCDANGLTPPTLDPVLKKFEVPIFGAVFPEVIMDNAKYSKGTVVAGLSVAPEVRTVKGLSGSSGDFDTELDSLALDSGRERTMFVFVDGFSSRISALIEGLFNVFGLEINYVGGGAGSLTMEQKPCVFTNSGMVMDSAVLAVADLNSGIGVTHGWQPVSGPYRVTEGSENVIKTLDWKPALEVYAGEIEKHSGKKIKPQNFFDIAKNYPFGINKMDADNIVRDPFRPGDDGSLICVGEVPEGAYVKVLSGDKESLISAAGDASRFARESFPGNGGDRTAVFFDCISRVLFLGEDFDRELEAVSDGATRLIGALSIGEIANNGKTYLEFYNKTAVVCILEG